MALICDGMKTKQEVLDQTLDEYREVFLQARRQFNTLAQVIRTTLFSLCRMVNV